MNPPRYIQIDTNIFADNKVNILLRRHGGVGLAVFVYCLVELGRQADGVESMLEISDIFKESASYALNISIEDIALIIDEMLRIGLLVRSENGGIFSRGFDLRTGKELLANKSRSEKMKQRQTEPETSDPKPPLKPSHIPEIIDHWNSKAQSLRCMKITTDIEKAIAKRCKEYTLEEIKQGIENYHEVLSDPKCFFSYKWNLGEFLSRQNGFPVFYGDRDEIIGKYRKSVGKNANTEQPKSRKELLETYK